jgi:hypothetical protein
VTAGAAAPDPSSDAVLDAASDDGPAPLLGTDPSEGPGDAADGTAAGVPSGEVARRTVSADRAATAEEPDVAAGDGAGGVALEVGVGAGAEAAGAGPGPGKSAGRRRTVLGGGVVAGSAARAAGAVAATDDSEAGAVGAADGFGEAVGRGATGVAVGEDEGVEIEGAVTADRRTVAGADAAATAAAASRRVVAA